MNRFRWILACLAVGIAIVVVTARRAESGAADALVRLQQSTPGVQQIGHSNLSGTSIAGQFVGGGAGVTGINAANVTSGVLPGNRLFGTYGRPVSFTDPANVFVGDGSGLTGINATLSLPYTGTANTTGPALSITNANGTVNSGGIVGVGGSGGTTFGVSGLNGSPTGYGIYGYATSTSGTNYGGYFETKSNAGFASYGLASSPGGGSMGGFFQANGPAGHGVHGYASSTSGTNFGVIGVTDSGNGFGVYGINNGVGGVSGMFETASPTGKAVYGSASANSGVNYAVLGTNLSTSGVAVGGRNSAATGFTFGGSFQSDSTDGTGVSGVSSASSGTTTGVYGKSSSFTGYGVHGESAGLLGGYGGFFESAGNGGRALYAYSTATNGTNYGVYAQSISPNGRGIYGVVTNATGAGIGVFGQATSTAGIGVYGYATASTGSTYSGFFQNQSSTGQAVHGTCTSTFGDNYAGYFESSSSTGTGLYAVGGQYGIHAEVTGDGGGAAAVYAVSNRAYCNAIYGINTYDDMYANGIEGVTMSPEGHGVGGFAPFVGVYGLSNDYDSPDDTRGVWGVDSAPSGMGVYGSNANVSPTATPYGVFGQCSNLTLGFGVYAQGDSGASGLKAFRIDHPFDPEHKYLLHYSTESPFPQNFYSGNVVTDAKGFAWVQLPDYFDEINTNFKYQLTVIDDGDEFVMAKVTKEVAANRFQVRTSKPGTKVSWRVEADRNDLYVRAKRPTDIREKTGYEFGKYQHPELYGLPASRGMHFRQAPVAAPLPKKS